MMNDIAQLHTVALALGGDERLEALARRYGTPLYVYDLTVLRRRVTDFRAALAAAGAKLFFATMANDRPPVLQALAALGVGACVNSVPHLELARDAGFPVDRIQFTSTGITREDMLVLERLQIQVNLDSEQQVASWFDRCGTPAGLRVNAGSLMRGQRLPDRLGIDSTDLSRVIEAAARRGGTISGLHIYAGTNFQCAGDILPVLEAFFDLAGSVPDMSYVNIGGGVGVDYRHSGPGFDLHLFGDALAGYAAKLRARTRRAIDVIVEPGRALVAACGTFVAQVTDVKNLNDTCFAAVDGSVAVFPRPLHHPETPHRIRRLTGTAAPGGASQREVKVVGRTTFSRDILGSLAIDGSLSVGDLLAFDDAGAYSQSMASRFLGQPEPSVAYID